MINLSNKTTSIVKSNSMRTGQTGLVVGRVDGNVSEFALTLTPVIKTEDGKLIVLAGVDAGACLANQYQVYVCNFQMEIT